MKPSTPELAAFLAANNHFAVADLYTLTARDGTVYRWTGADVPITIPGNQLLASAAFGGAPWTFTNAAAAAAPTMLGRSSVGPAFALTDTATLGQHSVLQSLTGMTAGTHTFSVYAFAGEVLFMSMRIGANGGAFDLSTGAVGALAGATGGAVNVGGGWWRCWITAACLATDTVRINMGNGMVVGENYSGVGGEIFIAGAMISAGTTLQGYNATTTAKNASRVFLPSATGSAPTVTRGGTRQAAGGEVGTLDVTLGGAGVFLGGSSTLTRLAREGFFDGCSVVIERVFMPTWGDYSLGVLLWFAGTVSKVGVSSNTVKLTTKEATEKLNLPMPRHTYQPSCGHTLFDAGCGVVRASFMQVKTAAGGTTTSFTAPDAQASGYYTGGAVTFTNGRNQGVTRVVTAHTQTAGTGTFTLGLPLLFAVSGADTCEATPGCDKAFVRPNGTSGDCVSRFANSLRFRGFPYVPKPESVR